MYVALSRLKNLEGLTVCNYDEKSLKANKRCIDFMNSLDRIYDKSGRINKKYYNYISSEN